MTEESSTGGFDGVEIPDSDMAALLAAEQPEQAEEKPTDGEGQQQEEPKETEEDPQESGEPTKIKVGDAEYTEDEIAEALEDRRNKSAWQKTNTEEAQKVAAMRKAIEPVVKFVGKLKGDGEFSAEIRDAAIEKFGEEFGSVIDAAIAFDENEHPHPLQTELDSAKTELDALKARIEGENAIQAEMKELRKAHGLSEEKAGEVLEFAGKKFEETGQALTLEDAFKLMDYENVKKKAEERKAPKVPDVPRNEQGAKDIKSKPAGSYEDISLEGFNVFS